MNEVINKHNGRYIRSLKRKNLSKIKEWRNSQMNILRQWKPLTEHNQENWFQEISEDESQVIFEILRQNKDERKIIGYCGITNIDFKNRRGEVSFLISPERKKDKDLYKEDFLSVLYMLCQYGFESLNLHKIFTETFDFREHHINILEEFGFSSEGVLKEHEFVDGEYFNSCIHSILQKKWFEIREMKYNGK